MQVIVVTDREGRIIALHQVDVQGATDAVPSKAGVVARRGTRVHTVEVPDDFAARDLEEIHARARLDLSGETPQLLGLYGDQTR